MGKKRKNRRSCGNNDEDLRNQTFDSSSSSKFGSFILLASADKYSRETLTRSREHSLVMLSGYESGYESGCESVCQSGCHWPWRRLHDCQVDNLGASRDQVFGVELNEDQLVLKFKRFAVPSIYESCYFFKEIVGSCYGLVCLYDRTDNWVCLWNPFTKQHRIIKRHKKHFVDSEGGYSSRHVAVGFGFDCIRKQYKVVVLNGFRPMASGAPAKCPCIVSVYVLETDTWHGVNIENEHMIHMPDDGDPFAYPTEGLYLNGNFFFMAKSLLSKEPWELGFTGKNDRLIISFNFVDYSFTSIKIPEHDTEQKLYLTCKGDKLALFTKFPTRQHEDYTIWVLEKQDESSWEKLHSFKIQRISPGECNTPVGISNDGEFALFKTCDEITGFCKKMKLYHFATEEVKRFLSCSAVMYKAIAYEPSQVSVISEITAAEEAKAAAAVIDRVIGNGATNP